jgi:predicted enzyme related to lactoylglutathione lyase
MDKTSNALNWFEVPALDISRAKKFYSSIFEAEFSDMPEMMGMKMAAFPADWTSGKVSGALAQSEMHKPGQDGAIVYLNANPDIQKVLDRVETAGGKVAVPRTSLGPNGFMAFIIDTEGNKMGLHAEK